MNEKKVIFEFSNIKVSPSQAVFGIGNGIKRKLIGEFKWQRETKISFVFPQAVLQDEL